MGDIFKEIDEEIRKDRLEDLWKRYGRFAVGLVISALVGVGSWKGWEAYSSAQMLSSSKEYEAAIRLQSTGKNADASTLFRRLMKEGNGNYKTLATLGEAGLRSEKGDIDGAISAYLSVSDNPEGPKFLREAATLFSVLLKMNHDSYKAEDLIKELDPLRKFDGIWRFTATELQGLINLKLENIEGARKIFKGLERNMQVPDSMRGRVKKILAVIG